MNCPHCSSTRTTQLQRTTDLEYFVFRCKDCCHMFNERTGTPFNFIEVPTDIIFQVLLCRLRYKLSFRDIAEFFLLRGFEFTHETVHDWEERFAPIFADQLRAKRQGKVGKVWFVDETYIRVKGKWCYLYRGIDEDGNLVDVRGGKTQVVNGQPYNDLVSGWRSRYSLTAVRFLLVRCYGSVRNEIWKQPKRFLPKRMKWQNSRHNELSPTDTPPIQEQLQKN